VHVLQQIDQSLAQSKPALLLTLLLTLWGLTSQKPTREA